MRNEVTRPERSVEPQQTRVSGLPSLSTENAPVEALLRSFLLKFISPVSYCSKKKKKEKKEKKRITSLFFPSYLRGTKMSLEVFRSKMIRRGDTEL